eukprot:gnl/TRDRNA2_/TRDRNA2_182829_c0_seq1.p1 gnl/TRDRNA2_/TRDRNA2_182829_c0~~gnl/TRDRNA2_/TRDRNA2_182829_c0_seq1.p1  ORF type:complete len:147 (+),score=18.58 gnl/TRDRNA2_/TRDRNA2_182829_c0_seq1:67-507(+)
MSRSVLFLLLISSAVAVAPSGLRKQPTVVNTDEKLAAPGKEMQNTTIAEPWLVAVIDDDAKLHLEKAKRDDPRGAGKVEDSKEIACKECSKNEKLLDDGHHRCICHAIHVHEPEARRDGWLWQCKPVVERNYGFEQCDPMPNGTGR